MCITPLNRQSYCVSIYDCPQLFTPSKQRPLSSHVINYLRQSQCGFEGNIPRRRRPTSVVRPIDGEDPVYEEDSYPESRDKCGIENDGNRIIGGQLTELDEFPWMALLGYQPRNNGPLTYQCGGVLINHRYILSAAHCVVGEIEKAVGKLVCVVGEIEEVVGKLTSARLGEHNTKTDIDCAEPDDCADSPQEILVHSSYPNPGFSKENKNRQDDIAVIRLARRAVYTTYVQPICLIDYRIRLSAGDDVFVAGWGSTQHGNSSPIKLKLNMPIFAKSECVLMYRTLGADLTDNQLCAGGVPGQDACRGDSGGPLMRKTPTGTWETVAVVSFGYGCGRDGWPGVYTSVANYIDGIRNVMALSNV
ncbi:phenoloxidase-activating enzyme 1-like [Maniola hyperantus]|uniref:phenoloxidase-activating enzyme 1-like n=1 Tax=Aphantopus hyperantus TaxID=2795564 RepID=UPI00374906E9